MAIRIYLSLVIPPFGGMTPTRGNPCSTSIEKERYWIPAFARLALLGEAGGNDTEAVHHSELMRL